MFNLLIKDLVSQVKGLQSKSIMVKLLTPESSTFKSSLVLIFKVINLFNTEFRVHFTTHAALQFLYRKFIRLGLFFS